jgi:hypothetical protein
VDKIQAINRSLRCFVFGLLALIPVLGLPMGAVAWMHAVVVARKFKGQWNPAQRYLLWGRALGLLGGLLSITIFPLLIWAIATGQFSSPSCARHT